MELSTEPAATVQKIAIDMILEVMSGATRGVKISHGDQTMVFVRGERKGELTFWLRVGSVSTFDGTPICPEDVILAVSGPLSANGGKFTRL